MDRLSGGLLPPLSGEFYQYVLAAVYHADGVWGEATFDLYARRLPAGWGYMVAAGLDPLLHALQHFKVGEEEAELLRKNPLFSHIKGSFFDHLKRLRFQGEVWAVPEGSIVFPGEPLLRITAPLTVCTLLETTVIQLISSASLVATRASRITEAAAGKPVIDFGSRRWPDPWAGTLAARAAYLGGMTATSNAYAAVQLGIPVMGSMPDTFLAAYGEDQLAVKAFLHHFPKLCHLTLPQDEVEESIRRFLPFRAQIQSVRVDHRDLAKGATEARTALDRVGLNDVKIMGSGDLEEVAIAKLVAAGVPIDWFAVGKALSEAQDRGRMAFRIAEMARGPEPVPVTREGSAPYPGIKQIYRFADRDMLGLEEEAWELERRGGLPLLQPVMREGQRLGESVPLAESRAHRQRSLQLLPPEYRSLERPEPWRVGVTDRLAGLVGT